MDSDSADDNALWAAAVGDVRPLAPAPHHRPAPAQLRGAPQAQSDEATVMHDALHEPLLEEDLLAGDETEFRRAGVNRQQMRRLRRGQFSIQSELDLHGLTRAEAAAAIRDLLAQAKLRGWRCLRIIHGKGLGSPGGKPVLKARVELSLQRSDEVLAYASAPPWAGGYGAILVLLRAS